jgi:hypothetical protein
MDRVRVMTDYTKFQFITDKGETFYIVEFIRAVNDDNYLTSYMVLDHEGIEEVEHIAYDILQEFFRYEYFFPATDTPEIISKNP